MSWHETFPSCITLCRREQGSKHTFSSQYMPKIFSGWANKLDLSFWNTVACQFHDMLVCHVKSLHDSNQYMQIWSLHRFWLSSLAHSVGANIFHQLSEEQSALSDHEQFCYGKTLPFYIWNIACNFQIRISRKHLKSRTKDTKITGNLATRTRQALKKKDNCNEANSLTGRIYKQRDPTE